MSEAVNKEFLLKELVKDISRFCVWVSSVSLLVYVMVHGAIKISYDYLVLAVAILNSFMGIFPEFW